MGNNRVCSGCSVCSGVFCVRVLDNVRVALGYDLCCDYSSVFKFVRVFSVEKLWESLREKLWINRGKLSTIVQKCGIWWWDGEKLGVFHGMVEKFCGEFSTRLNRLEMAVLHSFHRVYYNYYYLYMRFLVGTA